MISAGRVLLMPKGDYDSTATYEMLDIVSYNGSSYIAKSTTTGNLPTNTTYWQLSAYGGQAANLAGNFAPLETTDYASRAYAIDDIFVDKSSQLVIATTTINIGDEIEIGSNCDATTMAELLDAIENRYDALDQRNRKLVGINPITIQTDLHLLAPGEYFKKLTTFYVTNAPTGINQVPTAVFRLTVESGLDESGSSLILTLRTLEGATYTQVYNGTSWSDWEEVASKAYVDGQIGSLGTAAAKDSTNAVTSGSTDLVESGAVYTEIQTLTNQVATKADSSTVTALANDVDDISDEIADMNNVLGAKNLLPNIGAATSTDNGITYTKNSDGSVTANGTATGWAYYNLCSRFTLDAGTYILSGKEAKAATQIKITNADTEADVTFLVDNNTEKQFTLNTKTTLHAMLYVGVDAGTVTNFVFYPMIRPASIQDDTYVPYSMTNREMTPYVQAISNPNLLDNPWFTVNQRGKSSYSEVGYTVDRWAIRSNYTGQAITINNGLVLPAITQSSLGSLTVVNIFENDLITRLAGKTVTLSAIVDNVLYSFTETLPSNVSTQWDTHGLQLSLSGDQTALLINLYGPAEWKLLRIVKGISSAHTITAVKLELGSVSTLAMDTAPNYATELLKCQRYFVRYISPDFFEGYTYDATTARFGLVLPVPMRTNPSFSVDDITHLQVIGNGSGQALTTSQTISNSGFGTNKKVMEISGLATALSANIPVFVKLNSGYIDLSADL